MPSEHPPVPTPDAAVPERDPAAPGTKLCGRCATPTTADGPIVAPAADGQIAQEQPPLCAACRGRAGAAPAPLRAEDLQDGLENALRRLSWQAREPLRIDTELAARERQQRPPARSAAEPPRTVGPGASPVKSPVRAKGPVHSPAIQLSRSHNTSTGSAAAPSPITAVQVPASLSRRQAEKQPEARTVAKSALPDPFVDITRLRLRPRGYHCLYPGASFSGTQKSGKSEYDVTVTIVDVDITTSFLCGYLTIRGLTDDWPEMTTYFDAEIIGSRHGFITQKWGATKEEDLLHWGKFPAFRHAHQETSGPALTMPDRDRGAVFMRWKERFLVPDHRVQDISGASFAGFYYVCVDFSPRGASSSRPPPMQRAAAEGDGLAASKQESAARARAPVSASPMARRSSSFGGSRGTATMNGYYFHQNSEPYQQLALQHVPENTTPTFEFR